MTRAVLPIAAAALWTAGIAVLCIGTWTTQWVFWTGVGMVMAGAALVLAAGWKERP